MGRRHAAGQEDLPRQTTDRGPDHAERREFTLKLDPKNLGVLLRRKLDYAYPNQRAEVFVADAATARRAAMEAGGRSGTWPARTPASSPTRRASWARRSTSSQTSNRRFRDDEFLLPRGLTAGRSAIRVRVKFTPVERPLFPGYPLGELAWSEMRYTAYSYVMPAFRVVKSGTLQKSKAR